MVIKNLSKYFHKGLGAPPPCNSSYGRRVILSEPYVKNTAIANKIISIAHQFPSQATQVFKNDLASTVFAVQVGEMRLVVKRYNSVGWTRWRRAIGRSRARKSWDNSHRLHSIGINTVLPVALIEDRLGPLCLRAIFVSLFETGISAHEYFRTPGVSDAEKKNTAGQIIESLATLHSSGIIHGDTKSTNILVTGDRVTWLDLDAMSVPTLSLVHAVKKRKDWKLLLFNWKDLPTIQRIFIKRLGHYLSRSELFGILNELVRYQQSKWNSKRGIAEMDSDSSKRNAQLLRCIGIANAFHAEAEMSFIEPLDTLFPTLRSEQRQQLLMQIGKEIGFFHGCGFVHGSLRPENLRVSSDNSLRIAFSDIAGVRHFRRFSFRNMHADLVRFNREARRFLSDSERASFFSGYFRTLGRERNRERWVAAIERLSDQTGGL